MEKSGHKEDAQIPITWTRYARRSFAELIAYLQKSPYSYPASRAREITTAIGKLAYLPKRYPVRHIRNGKEFRRLIVRSRIFVYYVYFPSPAAGDLGRISIRGVKHTARKRPFAGVREPGEAEAFSMAAALGTSD